MHNFFIEIWSNKIVWTSFLCWGIAQSFKVLLGVIKEKRFNFKWFVDTGGMPSSHTAGVVGLAMAVGFSEGFYTPLFAIAAVFAVVTMFDAQGVRRSSGEQAETLNKIIEDIYSHKGLQQDRLKEFLGHTPVEVLVGALVGIVAAWGMYL